VKTAAGEKRRTGLDAEMMPGACLILSGVPNCIEKERIEVGKRDDAATPDVSKTRRKEGTIS